MLKLRAIRKSLHEFVVSLFETPPAATGWANWNVYGEDELRQGDDFTPVSPYVYIVDSFIAPTQTQVPLIVIEMSLISDPYQLGDAGGKFGVGRLHVFGRNRGERDDMASMLQDVLAGTMATLDGTAPFPVYDYLSTGLRTLVETAHINPGIDVTPIRVGEEETFESSTLNWNQVSFSFRTKQ
jgi:hypothetical protein